MTPALIHSRGLFPRIARIARILNRRERRKRRLFYPCHPYHYSSESCNSNEILTAKNTARPAATKRDVLDRMNRIYRMRLGPSRYQFCPFGILFILFILSISFRKRMILTDCSTGSAPECCSETAVTPLHTLKPKHLCIFEPLHSPLHSVTFRYIFGCVITSFLKVAGFCEINQI